MRTSVISTARGAIAIVSIALLCALGAVSVTPASAATWTGTWTGTTHGTRMASNGLVSGGFTWRGDFWFTAYRDGTVRGHAVVGYQPLQDLTVLNSAITYVRDVATDLVNGLLPTPWAVAANGLGPRQIVGTSIQFSESMGIREGPISGRLDPGARKLTLRWKKPKGIGYGIYLRLATGTTRIGGENVAGLPNPFTKQVGELMRGRHAKSVHDPTPSQSGNPRYDSYWVAHRTG